MFQGFCDSGEELGRVILVIKLNIIMGYSYFHFISHYCLTGVTQIFKLSLIFCGQIYSPFNFVGSSRRLLLE